MNDHARSTAPDGTWLLVEEGFDPVREREVESLFTVANGYLGTRGSLPEGSEYSRPATFVAGTYDTPPNGVREIVVAPDWATLKVFVAGAELRLDVGATLDHRRNLNMRQGLFEREWRHQDAAGRVTRLRYVRFASLADRHALVELVEIIPENYSARVSVESTIERGSIVPSNVVPIQQVPIATARASTAVRERGAVVPHLLLARTRDSGLSLAYAATTVIKPEDLPAERVDLKDEGCIGARWTWEAEIGLTYCVAKLVAVYTSRDGPDPGRLAADHVSRLHALGVDALRAAHAAEWEKRWEAAAVTIDGDPDAQRAVNFALYHLIATANPDDDRVSIGARLLTGDSYAGHVFWDTEIYMLPFYLFTDPASARSLLMYRYHTLPDARQNARLKGYRGALYPWEATDTGKDATPPFVIFPDGEVVPVLTGEQAHHISADVAYAVWQYWSATGDESFFEAAGAEILLETARFWASRAALGADGRYHIRHVIGPDEYHVGVDDNAYTNGMAQWNLERGVETAALLRERWPRRWAELTDRLAIASGEPAEWQAIAQAMYTGFDERTGLFEQFRGYFDLDYVDLRAYEQRTAPMTVILGHDRVARTQIVKQPDVVMLIFLLWDRFPPSVRETNFRYYEPRCDHGSSLSPSIHALVAARLGNVDLAERYFRQSAEIDLANNMGNSAGGVHAAAQGGLWQALTFGFAGMQLRDDGLSFAPHLLPRWQKLTFPVQWRGRTLRVAASQPPPTLELRLTSGEPMVVGAGDPAGPQVRVQVGKRYRARAKTKAWRAWEEARV